MQELLNKIIPVDTIILSVDMRVKIINDTDNFPDEAGTIKTITKILPDFDNKRAFQLDNETGIYQIGDFEYCIDYPSKVMI